MIDNNPKRPLCLVRVDASARLGWGHLKRCQALVAALSVAGFDILWAGHTQQSLDWPLPPTGPLSDAWIQDDVHRCKTTCGLRLPALVVVDHYRLDARWHRAMRAGSGALIFALDDLADRQMAVDLLLDTAPHPDHRAKYGQILDPGVPLLGGPRYALLDPVYLARRPRPIGTRVDTIGIFMGGTDPEEHSAWVLEVLRREVGWLGPVCLASTSENPSLARLEAVIAHDGAARMVLDSPHLADFHAACDLQIGAGGGALWERCFLGVPSIALVCVDNQAWAAPAASAAGAVVGLEARARNREQTQALARALRQLIDSQAARQSLQNAARRLVDGRGAWRVAGLLSALCAQVREALPPSAEGLHWRVATWADTDLLLEWRNDLFTRAASHCQAYVPRPGHLRWMARSLASPTRRLWLALVDGRPVALLRLDREPDDGCITLSWTVAPQSRGKGLGNRAVRQTVAWLPGALRAEVRADNAASRRVAVSAGLKAIAESDGIINYHRPARP